MSPQDATSPALEAARRIHDEMEKWRVARGDHLLGIRTWEQRTDADQAWFVRVGELAEEYAAGRESAARKAALEELATDCAATMDDPRIDYVEVQMSRESWKALQALQAMKRLAEPSAARGGTEEP